MLIARDGHLKLSDFGLATGFHKMHDSTYYQRLLSQDPNSASLAPGTVKNIELTLSRKDTIATWKKNRRALAYSTGILYNFMIKVLCIIS